MSHKPLCCQRRQRTPTSHHTTPGHRPSTPSCHKHRPSATTPPAPSCHLHGCHQRYCATQTVTAACGRDADAMTHAVPTLTDAVATLSPHPAASLSPHTRRPTASPRRRRRHTLAIPPRQHAYGVATPSSGRRYTIALDAVTTPSRVSMLSPCHHRHAMLSSRLRTVSTLSPRGHHASVTAMPMLSRRHTLATSPPHGCRCSLTSRGRRRRQPHPPRLSCTSSLITSSWLHRAARA